jgi:hypothetical protein
MHAFVARIVFEREIVVLDLAFQPGEFFSAPWALNHHLPLH